MKIFKYSLCAFVLSGASCWGMESSKLSLSDFNFQKNITKNIYVHEQSGLKEDMFQIFCSEKETDIQVAYIEMSVYNITHPDQLQDISTTNTLLYEYLIKKYENKYGQLAELNHLEIETDCCKGRGLGTLLFKKAMRNLQHYYPTVLMCYWNADPFDGEELRGPLLRFYRNCGALELKREIAQELRTEEDDVKKNNIKKRLNQMNDIFYIDFKK